jgi:hypothetical protein
MVSLTKVGRAHAGDSDENRKVLAESRIHLADGLRLTSVIVDTTETQPDPIDVFVQLQGIKGEGQRPSRFVTVHGVGLTNSTDTAAIIAAATIGGYAVVTGSASPQYASLIARNQAQVAVSFAEGDVNRPIVVGSLYNSIVGLGSDQASLTGGPNAASLSKILVEQLGLPDPCAAIASSPCSDIAIQLDVDANEDLLLRVFQGSGVVATGSTVTVCVSAGGTSLAKFQAVTDSNGLAQFNGPSNTITLGAQTSITGVTIQFANGETVAVCTVLGNPCKTAD